MKNMALVALCFFSTFATASDIEEVVVKARHTRIVMIKLAENHVQDPKTGDWHYVEERKVEDNKA